MPRASIRLIAALVLTSPLIACGGGGDSGAGNDTAGAEDTPAATPAPAAPVSETAVSAEASMTVEDIDRWERGMTAELAAVREAGVKFRSAKSSTDSMTAMMEANDVPTRAPGARAAGVDESRYGTIRSTLSSIVRYMVPAEQEMDMSKMPAEMIAAMNKDREQTFARMSPAFPPAVIEALRPRALALRKQELTLVGERLKAAGLAR